MWASLGRHAGEEWTLFALCLDSGAYDAISAMRPAGVVPVRLADLETADPSLLAVKSTRSRTEYYFTITPCLVRHLFHTHPRVALLTYLDADLFFFGSPNPLFQQMGDASVLIIPHRFPDRLKALEENGLYNVGFLSFRREATGLDCLEYWREQCLDWCYDRHEAGRFADQKYLDEWPRRFRSVCVLRNAGANLAPWNLETHHIGVHHGQVTVDGVPLIFYHAHGYRQISQWLIDPGSGGYGNSINDTVGRYVMLPYVRAVVASERRLARYAPAPRGRGDSRHPSDGELGVTRWTYKMRLLLEGVLILRVGTTAWYMGSPFIRQRMSRRDRPHVASRD